MSTLLSTWQRFKLTESLLLLRCWWTLSENTDINLLVHFYHMVHVYIMVDSYLPVHKYLKVHPNSSLGSQ
jgi:hypothetical protein